MVHEENTMRRYWSGHQVLDPTELEARFCVEDGLGFLDSTGSGELSEENVLRLDKVRGIMEMLPPREADFVELYYFRHMKQTDIAEIFQVSQPTVCYRLQRATARIQFLLDLPDMGEGELEKALSGFLSDDLDVRIMMHMFETTCQSEAAKRLGVSQGLVRHRFIRSITRMESVESMGKYAKTFRMIHDNLNILREVKRPSRNGKAAFSVD